MSAMITESAMTLLNKRYLSNEESVDSLWDRVSGGNPKFRRLLSELLFLPNSPTLFNMGLGNGGTSSACFVFDVSDSLRDDPDSIIGTEDKAAAVAKAGGGVGYYFGHLRRKGSEVRSVHRKACGPVAVLRRYNTLRSLITQGGKRDLAQMGVLPVGHPDITEFIHCKDEDPQGLSSFNISVSWSDAWVKSAFTKPEHDEDLKIYLQSSGLWRDQCQSAWKSGCPGMLFHNTINRFNPNKHLGLIYATNPCGETPNRNNEPCNLGSLALPRYWIKGERGINGVDIHRLAEDACTATEFLDDILDRNIFPHPSITAASLLTRKLGLGVMGWADLLSLLHIHYDTEDAVVLGETLMRIISDNAIATSTRLAREKGPYNGYSDRTEAPMRRNETNTSIAPTGTIAVLANVWGSIEPYYGLDVERTTFEGLKLPDGVPDWVRKDLDGFVPKIASQISPEWHVRHQAAFQKYTDLGVSKTVNLPNEATAEDVSRIYKLMYDSGCKGGTIFRDGCRDEQVLVDKKKTSVFTVGSSVSPRRRLLPDDVASHRHKFRVGDCKGYLHYGVYEDGTLGEIFLRVRKQGTTISGMLDAWAIAFSTSLQYGASLSDLCSQYIGMRFDPSGQTKNPEIPVATSIQDYVVRWLELKFLKNQNGKGTKTKSGYLCPECSTEAIFQAGCLTCPKQGCNWTKCG